MDDRKLRKVIGNRIRQLRLERDMTQMDLARLMGLKSSGIISQFENGERGLKRENLFKAAEIFGIEPGVLLANVHMSEEDLRMHVAFAKLLKDKDRSEEHRSYYTAIKQLLKG